MEELIKLMTIEQLVELIGSIDDGDLSMAGKPSYIGVNDDDRINDIGDYFGDSFLLLSAIFDSRCARYDINDKWVIFDTELDCLYSFSDKETLFKFLNPTTLAEIFRDAEIELTITAKTKEL